MLKQNRIPFAEPDLTSLESEYVQKAMSSGWVGSKGDYIDKFEEAFAKYIGVDHAITTSSGTSALQLAYLACGLRDPKTITVPENTFIATRNMATLITSQVMVKSSEDDTWNLKLSECNSDFVVGVHLYGNPVDMGQVYRAKYTFIEDCAQALGSRHRWKKCGSFGKASVFSFHSAKMITTGEGGVVCTDDANVARRVRHLKNQSMTEPYKHDGLGFNFRMTNIQAAMGLAQLERIDELIDKKRAITKFYEENLSDGFIRQKDTPHSFIVKWANAFRTNGPSGPIQAHLLQSGIETRPGFSDDHTIVLPCSTKLTKDQLEFIVTEANQCMTS